MKVLIIGGPVFVGRRLIESALAGGHEVSLFNRGHHNPELFPEVEKLRGDRNGDLAPLRGRRWDVAIDTSGFVPVSVRRMTGQLRDSVEHYTFVSSISVYAKFVSAGIDEHAPVETITDRQVDGAEALATGDRPNARVYGELYGGLKARCEVAAEDIMPGRVLNVRPGLIVGAHDYTDRFTYWVRRVAEGGEVLAPGRPERNVRVIDARDLAEWIVRMTETRQVGVYNAGGARDHRTMDGMLEACRTVGGSDARFTWASEPFLLEHDVKPWSEMPLWIPEEHNGIFEVKDDKAVAAGLTFRPPADTITDTLAWDLRRPRDIELKAGLTRERERELLEKLNARD